MTKKNQAALIMNVQISSGAKHAMNSQFSVISSYLDEMASAVIKAGVETLITA